MKLQTEFKPNIFFSRRGKIFKNITLKLHSLEISGFGITSGEESSNFFCYLNPVFFVHPILFIISFKLRFFLYFFNIVTLLKTNKIQFRNLLKSGI